jgi:hypothetical protein
MKLLSISKVDLFIEGFFSTMVLYKLNFIFENRLGFCSYNGILLSDIDAI